MREIANSAIDIGQIEGGFIQALAGSQPKNLFGMKGAS